MPFAAGVVVQAEGVVEGQGVGSEGGRRRFRTVCGVGGPRPGPVRSGQSGWPGAGGKWAAGAGAVAVGDSAVVMRDGVVGGAGVVRRRVGRARSWSAADVAGALPGVGSAEECLDGGAGEVGNNWWTVATPLPKEAAGRVQVSPQRRWARASRACRFGVGAAGGCRPAGGARRVVWSGSSERPAAGRRRGWGCVRRLPGQGGSRSPLQRERLPHAGFRRAGSTMAHSGAGRGGRPA